MQSGLADFIEQRAETIVEQAITFARSIDVDTPLDSVTLRDHLPEIIQAIVSDLRTAQTRAEEIAKSEGNAPMQAGHSRSAAATHALHRAHSGFSISQLVAEYRAMRASVLRSWAAASDDQFAAAGEITRFNEAIDEAIAESVSHYADEVERWRNIFLGVLGHDLRSPLTAIMLTSEHIAGLAVDAPLAKAAQRLIRSGESMNQLLDKLLVYNRSQFGIGFEITKEDIDLAQACRDEIEQLQAAMPATRIHFDGPDTMRGLFDAGSIREALANLVVNARKYGAEEAEIRVVLREDGAHAALAVANAGDPIPRETLDLMFEPLRRGGVSGGELEQASLGLGLFIVSQIVKAHAGSIRAESVDGTTTFNLQLPRGMPQ
ncbi:sensor histidine kinase [Luteimonas sp. MC1572]|uniref:sensor histidine kinase n=1 Tax=Luteimonas sp. MC1572 TaxID=2799325 RepID=UPI0018F0F903|nr:sensor histidine kinase [Luteimonas sp. MC1572]MBJ6982752.1 sensor histidine kinase [Luteimonas sp. MC1572]QQO03988.1 sensor histidine kinase [Luteimonas sp. MC1572]